MNRVMRCILTLSILFLVACSSTQNGRYQQQNDSPPDFQFKEPNLDDATPRYEPYRSHNSKPYTVLGKTYLPLISGKGFVQSGGASWYGQKFHGHLTSNGEVYDMFAMTAAHKTLPLPSYVLVTNLSNGKRTIVRVNDRGPFHPDRIIDLSYAAAKKLDMLTHGTADVKLEVIHVSEDNMYTIGDGPTQSYNEYLGIADNDSRDEDTTKTQSGAHSWFIQVVALSDKNRANALATALAQLYQVKAETFGSEGVFKLRLGPFMDRFQVNNLLNDLKIHGYPSAFVIENNE